MTVRKPWVFKPSTCHLVSPREWLIPSAFPFLFLVRWIFFMGEEKQIWEAGCLFWGSVLLWHQNKVYSPLWALLGQITSWWSYSHFFKQSLCCIVYWFLSFWKKHLFILPCQVLAVAMWDLVPWPGIKPRLPTLEVWSFSHWITREVPGF